MKKNTARNGSWTIILSLTAAIGVYLFFVFFPQTREIHRLREEIATKQSFLSEASVRRVRAQSLAQEELLTLNYVHDHEGTRATPADVAGLFSALSRLIKDAGIETTAFRPESKQALAVVDRIPLTINCRGSLELLQSLPARIEQFDERIWIEELTLKRDEAVGAMTCEVKLAIFVNNFDISD